MDGPFVSFPARVHFKVALPCKQGASWSSTELPCRHVHLIPQHKRNTCFFWPTVAAYKRRFVVSMPFHMFIISYGTHCHQLWVILFCINTLQTMEDIFFSCPTLININNGKVRMWSWIWNSHHHCSAGKVFWVVSLKKCYINVRYEYSIAYVECSVATDWLTYSSKYLKMHTLDH